MAKILFSVRASISREKFSKSDFKTTKSALVGKPFCPPPRLPDASADFVVSKSDFENFSPEMDALATSKGDDVANLPKLP